MPTLYGRTARERMWEENALPIIPTLTEGTYQNPTITVDGFGRVTSVSGATSTAATILGFVNGTQISGGPFTGLNFISDKLTATANGNMLDISVGDTTVKVQKDGTAISATGFETINFTGNMFSVTDATNGVVNVSASLNGIIKYRKEAVTTATKNIGSPVEGTAVITDVYVTVNSAYPTGTILSVEDASGAVYMQHQLIDPMLQGTYHLKINNNSFVSNPQLVFVVGGTSPATGSALVEVVYEV